jgi:hypothetical protein
MRYGYVVLFEAKNLKNKSRDKTALEPSRSKPLFAGYVRALEGESVNELLWRVVDVVQGIRIGKDASVIFDPLRRAFGTERVRSDAQIYGQVKDSFKGGSYLLQRSR